MALTLGDRTLVEARTGGNRRSDYFGPSRDRVQGPPPRHDQFTGVLSTNAQVFSDWRSRVVTASGALMHDAVIGNSTHELRAGYEYERANLTDRRGYPGGRLYLDFDGAPDLVQLWDGATYRGRQSRTSLYAQDSWRPLASLTVNMGLRLDVYRGFPPYPAKYATEGGAPRVGIAWDVTRAHSTVVRTRRAVSRPDRDELLRLPRSAEPRPGDHRPRRRP